MARYVWNDRLKQSIRFSYWNELCVTDNKGALAPQPADKPVDRLRTYMPYRTQHPAHLPFNKPGDLCGPWLHAN